MKYDVVGSFLAPEALMEAKEKLKAGKISAGEYAEALDKAVAELVERQIEHGLPAVSSGEIRRTYWDRDFYFGLGGIVRECFDSGRVYQLAETFEDLPRVTGRICYNPEHPFFKDFSFLNAAAAGRRPARQTIPSPVDLFSTLHEMAAEVHDFAYSDHGQMAADIAEAYRRTIMHFYELGCRDIQLDDTVIGRLLDPTVTMELEQGGTDILSLHERIVGILTAATAGLPADMRVSLYISAGIDVVPRWHAARSVYALMPKIFAIPSIQAYYMPFELGNMESLEVLEAVPAGKEIVLGLLEAHSPYPDKEERVGLMVARAAAIAPGAVLAISPAGGFKLSSFLMRGLSYPDQWNKIDSLAALAAAIR